MLAVEVLLDEKVVHCEVRVHTVSDICHLRQNSVTVADL